MVHIYFPICNDLKSHHEYEMQLQVLVQINVSIGPLLDVLQLNKMESHHMHELEFPLIQSVLTLISLHFIEYIIESRFIKISVFWDSQ